MPKFANTPRLLMLSFSFLAVLILVLAACGAPGASTAPLIRSGGRTPVKGGTWIDDLLAANALLAQHGWVKGADGVRTRDGERLEFQYSTTAGNRWRGAVEVINQANWMKIGIKVDIRNYPLSTFFGPFLAKAVPGVYDIAEFAESGAYDPDNASILQCDQTALLTHYCNPQMDALVQQEQSSGDPAVRQQAFDGIHRLELTDFPFVIAFSLPDVAIHKQGTENYAPSVAGMGETINIWQWWCDNGTCPA